MRRLLVLGAVLLTLVTGCQRGGVSRIYQTSSGYLASEAMEEHVLCGYAMDAVRVIVRELLSAPNNDAALIRQTVMSYSAYASTLRHVAEMATTDDRRGLIRDAADAADAYAAEVNARDSYHVDLQPVMSASHEAFPGCHLGG